jgi:hypothetical protein
MAVMLGPMTFTSLVARGQALGADVMPRVMLCFPSDSCLFHTLYEVHLYIIPLQRT